MKTAPMGYTSDSDRRLGKFYVTPQVLALMTSGDFRVVDRGQLPPEGWPSRVVKSGYDEDRDAFWVVIQNPLLGVLRHGDEIPVLESPTLERLDRGSAYRTGFLEGYALAAKSVFRGMKIDHRPTEQEVDEWTRLFLLEGR